MIVDPEHPLLEELSDAAFRAYSRALHLRYRNGTSELTQRAGSRLANANKVTIRELVKAGLWPRNGRGWLVLTPQEATDANAETSNRRRAAGAKGAGQRWRSDRPPDGKAMAKRPEVDQNSMAKLPGRHGKVDGGAPGVRPARSYFPTGSNLSSSSQDLPGGAREESTKTKKTQKDDGKAMAKRPEVDGGAYGKVAQPASLSEALALPIRERAEYLMRDRHLAEWLLPERWPEVLDVARDWGEVRLGQFHRDKGVQALVELFAMGYSVDELLRASKRVRGGAWAQRERAAGNSVGLAVLTPEVVRRALSAEQNEQPISLVETVKARRRRERKERSSG